MIPGDIKSQMQLLAKAAGAPLVEVSDTSLDLPHLTPGDRVSAVVLASLPSGRFQVLISDRVLDLNLPKNTQPGDELNLTFISGKPRLTFSLLTEATGPGDTAASASQARPSVSLSDTAKFLGALLQRAAQQEGPQSSSLNKVAPLIAGAPASTRELARVLRGALSQSGLFYESHQAEWVSGKRPLVDLLREPQGRLSSVALPESAPVLPQTGRAGAQIPAASAESGQPQKDAAIQPQPAAEGGRRGQALLPQLSQQTGATEMAGAAAGKPAADGSPVHPQATMLVQQQLGVLDTRQLLWQGQVWPGQGMDWRIEEEQARPGEASADAPEWRTRLYLKLPKLGEVTAVLGLSRQGIRVDFKAAERATAETIKDNHPALYDALQAAGINVLGLTVERDGQA